MRPMHKSLLALTGLIFSTSAALSHDYEVKDIIIDHPTLRMPIANQKVTAGYMTMTNKGEADKLISATAKIVDHIELHTMKMEGDVMKMRELEEGIELPAGQTVTLEPGGLHLMFLGLKSELVDGDFEYVELEFKKAGKVKVTFQIDESIKLGMKKDMKHDMKTDMQHDEMKEEEKEY